MLDVNLERLRAHQKNIGRYRRLLATQLSDLERSYLQRRLSEEQTFVKALLQDALPDRFSARLPRIAGRTTTLDMAAMLHPADAFAHPMDVVDEYDLTTYEKRAILSSWAAEACAVPELGRLDRNNAVSFDDILDALHLVESEERIADHSNESGHHLGPDGTNTPLR